MATFTPASRPLALLGIKTTTTTMMTTMVSSAATPTPTLTTTTMITLAATPTPTPTPTMTMTTTTTTTITTTTTTGAAAPDHWAMMGTVGTWVGVGLAVLTIAVAVGICLWQNKRGRRAQPDLETGAVAVGAVATAVIEASARTARALAEDQRAAPVANIAAVTAEAIGDSFVAVVGPMPRLRVVSGERGPGAEE